MSNAKTDGISLAKLISIIAVIAVIPLLLSHFVIRTIYTNWLEPESTAGTVMLASYVVDKQINPQKKNILVLGDSRINEGFSTLIANKEVVGSDYNFISLGLAGSTPRIWFYLLKKIDPQKNKFFAIYIMARGASDTEFENLNDRVLDTSYLSGIFRLNDLLSYPDSFDSEKLSSDARSSIIFPAAQLQNDILAFIKHPKARVNKVKLWRSDYGEWLKNYPGRSERLPDLDSISNYKTVLDLLPEPQKNEVKGYFQLSEFCNKSNTAAFRYNSKWYGGVGSYYKSTAVKVGLFLIPRGPYHSLMHCSTLPNGSLKILAEKKLLEVLPSEASISVEKPEFFFDHLHLNKNGRALFSQKLAINIINSLED